MKMENRNFFFFFFFFFFVVKLGIFCLELGKKHTFWHGNGAEFRPQNRVIESPDSWACLGGPMIKLPGNVASVLVVVHSWACLG